jgi:ectoine hydroxylase-related dioxygenase (phytanoyl-CoA dioxygenase family)
MKVERHHWNQAFTWPDHRGPFRRISPAQARAYDEQGFFVIADAFDADTVARVVQEIDPYEAEVDAFLRAQKDQRFFIADARAITFSVHLVVRSALLRAFCADTVFCDLAADLLGPNVRLYWEQAVYKKSERPQPFPWHQDNGYTYLEPQHYLTCWVALTDATEGNGCPWVVPALHRLGTLRHQLTERGWQCLTEAPAAVPVPVRAGSIVVFSSLTPHATGPNLTAAVRKAYIVQFAPDGAQSIRANPQTGKPERMLQTAADRQYFIVREGVPVAPPD